MKKKKETSKTRKVLSYIIFVFLILCTFIFFGMYPLLNEIDDYVQKNSLPMGGTAQLTKDPTKYNSNAGTEKKVNSIEKNLELLKKACTDLTKSESRLYEPIIGYYLGSKSYSAGSPSGTNSDWTSHRMVLKTEGGEKIIRIGSKKDYFKIIEKKLEAVIGSKYLKWPDGIDTEFQVGICATESNYSETYKGSTSYIGIIDSLTKI